MSDDVRIEPDGSEETGGSEEELEAVASKADAKLAKLKKELEAVKKERQEYMDGWQRSKADYVNALKRFEAEKQSAKDAGLAKAVQALLPAHDALERAKEHGDVPEGFEGIAKQLEGAFASLGIQPVGDVGDPFDPSLHEALGADPTDDPEQDDRIAAVLEKGYRVGEAVLRPARVRIWQHGSA